MVELEMYLLCLHQPVLFSAALWHDIRICVDFDWEYVDVWSADCAISLLWRGGSEYVDARAYSDDGASSGAGGLSLYMNSAAVMSVITFILVLASYYGNRFLVHGYAMACRYYSDSLYPQDEVLTTAFGIPYLICLIVGLVGCGYGIIRKRNIIW